MAKWLAFISSQVQILLEVEVSEDLSDIWSVRMAKWLALLTLHHKFPGSNPTGSGILRRLVRYVKCQDGQVVSSPNFAS